MLFRLRKWRRFVLALAVAASSAAVVSEPALGQASPEPPTRSISQYVPILQKHLAKYARHPDAGKCVAREGVVRLLFSVDRRGRVLDARVARSSGSDALDREALDLFRRASPVPAPPSQLVGRRFALPIQFHSRTLSSSACRLRDP